MRVSDFHFDLPDELIARYPKEDRSSVACYNSMVKTGKFLTALLPMY